MNTEKSEIMCNCKCGLCSSGVHRCFLVCNENPFKKTLPKALNLSSDISSPLKAINVSLAKIHASHERMLVYLQDMVDCSKEIPNSKGPIAVLEDEAICLEQMVHSILLYCQVLREK